MNDVTQNVVDLHGRQPCPYCFRTIDVDDGHPDSNSFVQCQKCEAIYHTNCWRNLQAACINRLDDGYPCEHEMAKPIVPANTPPDVRAITRTPIRFNGVVSRNLPRVNVAPSDTPAEQVATTANQLGSLPMRFLIRFVVLTIAVLFASLWVFVDDGIGSSNALYAIVYWVGTIGGLLVFFTSIKMLRDQKNRLLRWGLPTVIGTGAFYFALINISAIAFISSPDSFVRYNTGALSNIPAILFAGVLALSVVLIADFVDNARRRIWSTTVVVVGVYVVVSFTLFLSLPPRLPLVQAIVILTAISGIGWLPELFLPDTPRRSASTAGQANAVGEMTIAPENLRRRGVLFRTILLALPMLFSFSSLALTFQEETCFNCEDLSGFVVAILAIAPPIIISYLINNNVIEPTLRNRESEGFWGRAWRALLASAIIGLMIGLPYAFLIEPSTDGLDSGSAVILPIGIGLGALFTAGFYTISAAYGVTRRDKIVKPIWLYIRIFFVFGLIGVFTEDINIPLYLVALAIGSVIGGLATTISTGTLWGADWLAKRGYLP